MIRDQIVPAIRLGIGVVFQALDSGAYPDKVDDALLALVAPGIVSWDIVGNGRNIMRVAHNRLQTVEGLAGDIRVEVSAENQRKAFRIDFMHLAHNHVDALFLGSPGEAEMGVEVEETLAGLIQLEKPPSEGTVILFIKGCRRHIRRPGHPEGAAVKQGENGILVQETGSFAFIRPIIPADTYTAIICSKAIPEKRPLALELRLLETDKVRLPGSEHLQASLFPGRPVVGRFRFPDMALANVETHHREARAAGADSQDKEEGGKRFQGRGHGVISYGSDGKVNE